ncbi:MAG: FAD-dependent oxidoreductase [Cytophagaceae bacterium]
MQIAIIGGGITGLTTAICLHKLGYACTVYEQAPQLSEVGAGIWMQPNAMKVLDWAGVGDEIRRNSYLVNKVDITNDKLKPVRNTAAGFIYEITGSKISSIHRARLQKVLANALPADSLKLNFSYRNHREDNDKVIVEFENGEVIKCDMLLAADGLKSKVRSKVFPESQLRYSGQTSWRGIAMTQVPDVFKSSAFEAWGKGMRFGLSPISENEVYWFAVATAAQGGSDNKSGLKNYLLEKYKDFHPFVSRLIECTSDDKILRTDISDLKRLSNWSKGRVCLLGDASHATTPNMGQGGGQGVEDAYYFSNFLNICKDYSKTYEVFENERRKKVDYVVNTSWTFGKLAHQTFGQTLLKTILKFTPDFIMEKQLKDLYEIRKF